MNRIKSLDIDSIIKLAKKLEYGETYYKIDDGSIKQAMIEARYYLEYGMSKDAYRSEQERIADDFMRNLTQSKD